MSVTFAVQNPNSDNQRQYPGVDIWPVELVPRETNLSLNRQVHNVLAERILYQRKGCFCLTKGQFAINPTLWPDLISMLFEGPDAMFGLAGWSDLMLRVQKALNQTNQQRDEEYLSALSSSRQPTSVSFGGHTPLLTESCIAPKANPSKPWTQLPFNIVSSILANQNNNGRISAGIQPPNPALISDALIHRLISQPFATWITLLPRLWIDALRHTEFFEWDHDSDRFVHLEGAHALSLANQTCSPAKEAKSADKLLERLWRRLTVMAPESDVLVITDGDYNSIQQIPLRTLRFHSTS
jgi:hypothetical protein